MKVIVINDDTDPTRELKVEKVESGDMHTEGIIGAGGHKEFMIWKGKSILISEQDVPKKEGGE